MTPVLGAAAGTVVCVNINKNTTKTCSEGPGEVKIDHGNGYFSIYLHLSSATVKAKDKVIAQQQIGISGNTGACTLKNQPPCPHLHFEVRQGTTPVDPYGWWQGKTSDPYTPAIVNLWK